MKLDLDVVGHRKNNFSIINIVTMKEYTILILIVYIFVAALRYGLEYLKISYLKRYGNVVPAEFDGSIDQELLKKVNDYTMETTIWGIFTSVFNDILILLFFFGGILNLYNTWITSLHLSFLSTGILFFLILIYADMFLSIPFSLYQTFRIENKYGFNTMTLKLWFKDFAKSLLISTILLSLVVAIALLIIQKSPLHWWFWVWLFFFLFSIFLMYISPYVIEPLFNKFSPIDDNELIKGIEGLTDKVGIKISKILKMDASKRTKHTNAYFTGIGKVKRVVLYDTLLQSLNKAEILAVLGHELGHWKKKHVLKQMFFIEIFALIVLYVSFKLIQGNVLLLLFNIQGDSLFAKIVILFLPGTIVSFFFTPLFSFLSRRHEKEADTFACNLIGDKRSLIDALVKLSKDNLSNLHPHPVYSAFYYSHPSVTERINYINSKNAFAK
ncbi:MAG: M48 family metallopeptidase [bacterium]